VDPISDYNRFVLLTHNDRMLALCPVAEFVYIVIGWARCAIDFDQWPQCGSRVRSRPAGVFNRADSHSRDGATNI
jgi:hypothetical protein